MRRLLWRLVSVAICGAILASALGCSGEDAGSTVDGSAPIPVDAGTDSAVYDARDGAIENRPDAATEDADAALPPSDADLPDTADAGPQTRYTDLVDPFIGTGGNTTINCFPGAIRPWGMVSASPDTTVSSGSPASGAHASGYLAEDDLIQGFSHTRLQGTSTPDQGSVLLMPAGGDPATLITEAAYRSPYDRPTEAASPGYYAVTLTRPKVRAEMTATRRGAFHRYTFQAAPTGGVGQVVLDLGHALIGTSVTAAELTVSGATLEGYTLPSGRFSGPSKGGLKTYFSIVFDPAPTSIVTWNGTTVGSDTSRSGTKIGAVASFPVTANGQVHARVGIS